MGGKLAVEALLIELDQRRMRDVVEGIGFPSQHRQGLACAALLE